MTFQSISLPIADQLPTGLHLIERSVDQSKPDALETLQLLDDEQEWGAFSRVSVSQPGCWESNVLIEGMHCAACALSIEDALKTVPGVLHAEVSAGSHRAKVVWSSERVVPSGWMQAVQRAGYRAVPANDVFARERRQAQSRMALWRMMVAGLCMMQVMMYAYPAYTAGPGDLSIEMEQLLRWASWVLSLPVLFFSCGPFFKNAWRDVLHRSVSMDLPVALGMLITFAVSTAGTFEPKGMFGAEVYFDSFTMFVFFLLFGRWLELRLRDKTAGALEALMNRLPDSVSRLKDDGGYERVPVRRLRVGDVIRVLPGESFAADGVVLQGNTSADESLLTGESRPVSRGIGDEVISGSHNLSGLVQIRVNKVGEETRFAQIVALMESASTSKPTLARMADTIAKPFLIGVLIAAGLSCAYWWQIDPEKALMVAVSVLVVTCPCALSLATPAAMLSAAGALAKRGVLVRRLEAFESLAAIDTVMFDKTGTLTRDAMVLAQIKVRQGIVEQHALSMAAALAQYSLHPVSKAIESAFNLAEQHEKWVINQVSEVPGQGIWGYISLPESAAPRISLRLGSADFCGVSEFKSEALQVHLSDENGWLASFEFQEDIRIDAAETVAALQREGVCVYLLSGDASDAANRVAASVGISEVRGHCSPQEKLDFLRNAQVQGRKVAVVGDGLNDGPVLAGAHASFAFGQAVPLAQAQADFLVSSSRLTNVVDALMLSRRTLAVVRQNLWWAAIYNAVCVPLAVLGLLPAWLAGLGMAGSSLLVVLNAFRLSNSTEFERNT
ncbi:MAG: Cu2+-exporting ATPase [Comamonadaceae bacterium]|nr:MAG: Cu2+-exporting ATPase [Comamonadaceae bacterium]